MRNHGPQCNWHWDQYDWECDCGAIPNPEALKPAWIAEGIARTKRLAAQPRRRVSPERIAAATAFLNSLSDGSYSQDGLDRDEHKEEEETSSDVAEDRSTSAQEGAPERAP